MGNQAATLVRPTNETLFKMIAALIAPAETYRLVPYHAPKVTRSRRVRLVPVRESMDMAAEKRIFVDGKEVGEAPEQSDFGFAPCCRRKGIAVNVSGAFSGAYTVSTNFGYVKWPRFARAYPGLQVCGVATDGTVLLLQSDSGLSPDSIAPTQGYLERGGVRKPIGPATYATILPDGTVIGTALRNGNGTYAEYMTDGAASPETFVWSHGKRTPLGRWVFLGRNPDGTILGATMKGSLATYTGVDSLLLYRRGATTPIDTRGLETRGPIRLRKDSSVVFGIAGEGYSTQGIAIWRKGKIERIPDEIDGHDLFGSSFRLGPKDEIVVEDEKNRLWRVTRPSGANV